MAYNPGNNKNQEEVLVEEVMVEEVVVDDGDFDEGVMRQQRANPRYRNKDSREQVVRKQQQDKFNKPKTERGASMYSRGFTIKTSSSIATNFLEVYKDIPQEKDYNSQLIVIDKSSAGINIKSDIGILVMVTLFGTDLYWHVIILEASDHPVKELLPNRHERVTLTHDHLEVINYRATYDGVTKEIVERIRLYLTGEFPNAKAMYYTDVNIIPTEVSIESKETVKAICFLAEDANWTLANYDASYNAANLGVHASISGLARFNQERIKFDLLGTPYRADFTIDVSLCDRENRSELLLESNTNKPLVTVDGFITAAYVGQQESLMNRSNTPTPPFVPEIAVTNINTFHDENRGQFDRGILGLAMLPFINSNNYWMRQFEMTFGNADKSRKLDGFAFGMNWLDNVIPPAELLESISHDPKVRGEWLRSVFDATECDVCVMVKDGGVDFTMGKLLINIGDNEEDAIRRLFTSINEITSDVFADICEKGNLSFTSSDIVHKMVRVPTGHFLSNDGVQPIEMVDTLYMLNAIKANSPELVYDWYDTTTWATEMYEDEAITRLIRVFQEVTGKQFVLKGFATKVYLGGAFLKVVYSAIERSPLNVTMEADAGSSFRRDRERPVRSANRNGLQADIANTSTRQFRNDATARRRRSFSGSSYH